MLEVDVGLGNENINTGTIIGVLSNNLITVPHACYPETHLMAKDKKLNVL